ARTAVRAEMTHWMFVNYTAQDRVVAGAIDGIHGTGGGVLDSSFHLNHAVLPIDIGGPIVIPILDVRVFGGPRVTFSNDRFLAGVIVSNPAINIGGASDGSTSFGIPGYLTGTADALRQTS